MKQIQAPCGPMVMRRTEGAPAAKAPRPTAAPLLVEPKAKKKLAPAVTPEAPAAEAKPTPAPAADKETIVDHA
jgi:hypothetical protein